MDIDVVYTEHRPIREDVMNEIARTLKEIKEQLYEVVINSAREMSYTGVLPPDDSTNRAVTGSTTVRPRLNPCELVGRAAAVFLKARWMPHRSSQDHKQTRCSSSESARQPFIKMEPLLS